ncbi:MarC family protein [Fischerella sp. JS2]|uniref:MarC family protein n=1 Tax=Fischerella sp. JS2 TaxID=2597771 RepID=UPI0037BE2F5D
MNVILVLATFLLAGKLILNFFGISLGVLRIARGLIVAHLLGGEPVYSVLLK